MTIIFGGLSVVTLTLIEVNIQDAAKNCPRDSSRIDTKVSNRPKSSDIVGQELMKLNKLLMERITCSVNSEQLTI